MPCTSIESTLVFLWFCSANVTTELAVSLHAKPCQPMNSDMRIVIPSGLNTYPDASVYCGKPELTDNNKTLLNPVLIVEVLSPSTRSYDRGDKLPLSLHSKLAGLFAN